MKPRKTYALLGKDQRNVRPISKPQRQRPDKEDDVDMGGDQNLQRKKIVPKVIEKYEDKK